MTILTKVFWLVFCCPSAEVKFTFNCLIIQLPARISSLISQLHSRFRLKRWPIATRKICRWIGRLSPWINSIDRSASHRASLRHDLHWPFARFRRFILSRWRDRATTLSLCPGPVLAACLFGKFVALDRSQFAAQLHPWNLRAEYTRQRAAWHDGGYCFCWYFVQGRGRENAAVAKSPGISMSRDNNVTKRKKSSYATNASNLGVEEESRKVDSERIHTRKFAKGPFY